MRDTLHSAERSLRTQQATVIALLTVGYAGYYFCRSNFSVAVPLLLEEFGRDGMTKSTLGFIASTGVFIYALGKFGSGIVSDFFGGRKVFLFGMAGSVAATVVFGLSTGVTAFLIAWSVNRLIQSMGWGGLVKIASQWFSHKQYGSVMGILSLSFLFGDALARAVFGMLINVGVGWRELFFIAALILAVIALLSYGPLKEKPAELGLPDRTVNPNNLFGSAGGNDSPASLRSLLLPFFKSPAFWLAGFMSVGLTLIRESFNFWTPTYLREVAHLGTGDAAITSLVFPFFGGLSVLLSGYISDKLGKGKRGGIIVASIAPLIAVLAYMGLDRNVTGAVLPVVLVSLSAFLLMGPYSFFAGAISLDMGGKQGSSTAAGFMDGLGYVGATLSTYGVGALADAFGWGASFIALAVVAALVLAAAFVYWINFEGKTQHTHSHKDVS